MKLVFFRFGIHIAAISLGFGVFVAPPALGEDLIELPTRPGVTQSFLFESPDQPKAAVILFAGGSGFIGLSVKDGRPHLADLDGNFLVRARHMFAAQGLMVATIDAPSDEKHGMSTGFRTGTDHARDIAAVAAWLKQKAPLPVWLVGTSQGSLSAAGAAIHLGREIDGLVLTSSVIDERGGQFGSAAPAGVLSLTLGMIAVPTLVMAHAQDTCPVSSPDGARAIVSQLTAAPRRVAALIQGGRAPMSSVCEAFAPHGFYGVEDQAVTKIATFILAP